MAGYRRKTVLGPNEVLARARKDLVAYVSLTRSAESPHSATYTGQEGTVVLNAHRHGPYTEVTADTDQLRTSRLDYEVQRFLAWLPYEPGDSGGGPAKW